MRLFGRNRDGPKIGKGLRTLLGKGELGPHLTQCFLSRGLPPFQVAFGSMSLIGHNRHGPKIGEGLRPLYGEEGLG